MKELRLLPAALLCWLVVLTLIISGSWLLPLVLIAAAVAVALVLKHIGQALFMGVVPIASGGVAWVKMQQAAEFEFLPQVSGRVGRVKNLGGERLMIDLEVAGYPVPLPVFLETRDPIERSSQILVHGSLGQNKHPGIGEFVLNARSFDVVAEPTGYAAWVNQVRDGFAEWVVQGVSVSSQGLIPGMVLGDTRLQGAIEEQMFIDTGLSHLSAVSGLIVISRGVSRKRACSPLSCCNTN